MSREPEPTPEDLDATLQSAIEAHRADRKSDAEKLYMRVLRFQPRNAEALNLLGVLAAQSGDFRRARELMKASLAQAPDSADYRFQYAHVLQLSGQSGVAQAYREALARDPKHLPSLVNLANLLLGRDEVDEAATLLQTATEVDGTALPAFEGLGLARHRQGRFEDSIAALEKAIALQPNSLMAPTLLGTVLRDAGRSEDALARLRAVAERAPGNADVQCEVGTTLLSSGDPRGAVAFFDKALTLDPHHVPALAAKPLALLELGDETLHDRLFDFDRLVAATEVTSVPRYDSVQAFNESLAQAIAAHPSLTGTRTARHLSRGVHTGELLDGTGGVYAVLGNLIQQALNGYFATHQRPEGPPFPVPLPQGCRLRAWGTMLQDGGEQHSHVHPDAVVSGLYHVTVPTDGDASGRSDETATAGAIELGRGGDDLKLTQAAKVRVIPAQAGTLLLFPSYLWQRILPWSGAADLITVGFDVSPLD